MIDSTPTQAPKVSTRLPEATPLSVTLPGEFHTEPPVQICASVEDWRTNSIAPDPGAGTLFARVAALG